MDEKRQGVEIIVNNTLRKELLKFACARTITKALRGDLKTELALNIREYALSHGGRYWR
ncbi:MAG: hypothetical protein MJZ30_09295 [Paludibacteraceae bacterium]|nr:hypothetical protein [Paludibacteraceae bacterium]